MSSSHRRRAVPLVLAAAVAFATTAVIAPMAHAAGVAALVAKAESDTNSVKSLVHHDSTVAKNPNITISFTATGQEDELHNREQDHEDVHVRGYDSKKKLHTLHYSADIIFLGGKTYYRVSTLNKNAWQTANGMKFNDPYTGGWKRARTKITLTKAAVFKAVGISGNQTHVRATISTARVTETDDLWISGGATPYVVKEQIVQQSKKVKGATSTFTSTLGNFNIPLVIQSPTAGGGST
jgi:hypothetical protein